MERLLKPYDKDSMKMAMLKHEETFKEQVNELHRLYKIQKMLMNNMKSSQERSKLENELSFSRTNYIRNEQQKPRRRILNLERPAEEYIADGNGDDSDIELTLGPTCYSRRKKDETPLTSDSGPSFSSSSSGSSYMKRTNIGTHKRTVIREDLTGHEWRLIQVPELQQSFQSGRKISYDVEEQLTQQDRLKRRPPWLFHALSLNTT